MIQRTVDIVSLLDQPLSVAYGELAAMDAGLTPLRRVLHVAPYQRLVDGACVTLCEILIEIIPEHRPKDDEIATLDHEPVTQP